MTQTHGIFGIDLGTTYSVVSYLDESGRASVTRNADNSETTPSVVYFESATNVVVGQVAKEAASQDPDNVVSLVKRHMGDKDYRRSFHGEEHTPSSLSAIILQALAQDAQASAGREAHDVVITVPAYFGLLEKEATRTAGAIAGLNVIGIIPEPVAAALQYGITGGAEGRTVLVYDLGGGTFDVSLIRVGQDRVEVVVVGGDHHLGGADWDDRLFEHLLEAAVQQLGDDDLRDDASELEDLRQRAEKLKRDLTSREQVAVQVRHGGDTAKVQVTRAQFEEMTRDLLEETLRITERTLADAEAKEPGVTARLDDVLLVGGSSYMPAVARALTEKFGWSPRLSDPNLAVAKGAALYAAGRTVKFWDPGSDTVRVDAAPGADAEGAVPDAARISAVAARTGLAEADLRGLAGTSIVNVLPKALGVKLVDTSAAGWQDGAGDYVHHLVEPNTALPVGTVTLTAATVHAHQDEVAVELWEQAGAVPTREMADNVPVDNGTGAITGLSAHRLPVGSPIHMNLEVDPEGTVHLRAVEPRSGSDLQITVRIQVLTEEEVAAATARHTGLSISS